MTEREAAHPPTAYTPFSDTDPLRPEGGEAEVTPPPDEPEQQTATSSSWSEVQSPPQVPRGTNEETASNASQNSRPRRHPEPPAPEPRVPLTY